MKRTKYKGVVDPAKRTGQTKTDLENDSLEPAYVKKYFKHKTPCRTVTQLKLFGNSYDMKY